jgi:hypothetical protein
MLEKKSERIESERESRWKKSLEEEVVEERIWIL